MRRVRLAALLAGVFTLVAGLSVSPARPADDAWGTITGVVKLAPPADEKPIPDDKITADKPHCLSKGPLKYEDVVCNKANGGLRYVVVWLRPDTTDKKADMPKEKIHPDLAKAAGKTHVIDQPCCQFIPRVVAARAGDVLDVKNSSPVNHNVNYGSDAESFNRNVPPGESQKTAPLAVQRSPIAIACNIHPWMKGWVRVFDHPYFAVTDENGKFEIKNAPAGKWRLVYWHENGFHKGRDGVLGFPVEVKGGGTTEAPAINFQFPPQG